MSSFNHFEYHDGDNNLNSSLTFSTIHSSNQILLHLYSWHLKQCGIIYLLSIIIIVHIFFIKFDDSDNDRRIIIYLLNITFSRYPHRITIPVYIIIISI